MHLKRKKLGPSLDLKEGERKRALAQAMDTEEGD